MSSDWKRVLVSFFMFIISYRYILPSFACRITIITLKTLYLSISPLLYTGSSFSLWKVTKIIFLFHQNYFSRKKFWGYRFRLHVLLLKLSTVSINSLLRRVEFIDFCICTATARPEPQKHPVCSLLPLQTTLTRKYITRIIRKNLAIQP